MIYGNIHHPQFELQCRILPRPIRDALHFLATEDLKAHETGRFPLQLNGCEMILQVLDLETKARKQLRPEIHRKYIDLQFLADGGPEAAGFYMDDASLAVDEDLLDTERDILLYESREHAMEGRLYLQPGSFALYFPWDAHIPSLQYRDGAPEAIRKIVIKIPLEDCLQTD